MSSPMKYIKDLEAVGFQRNQAEAQVQMVLDAIEGDLVTKGDFAVFEQKLENRFTSFESKSEDRFVQFEKRLEEKLERLFDSRLGPLNGRMDQLEGRLGHLDHRMAGFEQRLSRFEDRVDRRFIETEFRLTTRLGFLVISTTSIAVAVLTWLIKI